jgi:diguanylate cyclase (GGDEF)-like protein
VDTTWLIDLINGSPGADPRSRAGRVGATFFVAGGSLVIATVWFLPQDVVRRPLLAVGVLSIVLGPILALLPWTRLNRKWTIVPALLGICIIALGGTLVPSAIGAYLPMYCIPFVYTGLTQKPGRALMLAPLAGASFALIAFGAPHWSEATTHQFSIILPLAVVIGELLAQRTLRQEQADSNIEQLLEAVIAMGEMSSEEAAANLVAGLAHTLLGADSTLVMVAQEPGSTVFTNVGQQYVDVVVGEVKIDIATEPSGIGVAIRAGQTVFVSDAASNPMVNQGRTRQMNAQSVVFLPLPGEGHYLGAVVACWTRRKMRLDHYAQRTAELLSAEAGRTLERVRRATKLRQEAETDALTGLYNRRTLSRFLDSMNHGDAVVLIDLDHFKGVNDRLGHPAGDDTLSLFATAMRQVVRDGDCVSRYGGEEFVLVLKNASERGALSMLKRLNVLWTEFAPPTTYSAGVAVYEPGETPAIVLARSDAALYRAKTNGRDRVEVSRNDGNVDAKATWLKAETREHTTIDL